MMGADTVPVSACPDVRAVISSRISQVTLCARMVDTPWVAAGAHTCDGVNMQGGAARCGNWHVKR
jgi:hypothetical protein